MHLTRARRRVVTFAETTVTEKVAGREKEGMLTRRMLAIAIVGLDANGHVDGRFSHTHFHAICGGANGIADMAVYPELSMSPTVVLIWAVGSMGRRQTSMGGQHSLALWVGRWGRQKTFLPPSS